MLKNIEIGDQVNLYWENIQSEFNLTVIGKPCDVGDCWTLARKDGTIIKTILFSKMEQVSQ